MRLYLESFGCQMNKLDAELLLGNLEREGYEAASDPTAADVILLVTCSVRAHAEDRVVAIAGTYKALKRKRPELILGILGCMAGREGERVLKRIPHADLIAGPKALARVPAMLRPLREERRPIIAEASPGGDDLKPVHTASGRANPFQAYVKAMEGCDLACTYCVVPSARGEARSRSEDSILEEIRGLAGQGVVEVTLLGQTVDAYGLDLSPRKSLAGLLGKAAGVPGLERVRFVTSHPGYFRSDLLDAMATMPSVMPYLHLPVQSGSDRILKAMRRGYTAARYEEIAADYRARLPGAALSTDFIVGFPGETEEDFLATLSLMERVRFQQAFLFKYSPRPGTPAADLPGAVSEAEKKRRHAGISALQYRISLEENRARIGLREKVLVEGPSRTDPARLTGRTPQFRIVNFEGTARPGAIAEVDVLAATALSLYGRTV